MRHIVPTLLGLFACAAIAQPVGNAPSGQGVPLERDQRRSELREALQRSRGVVPPGGMGPLTPVGRHLSNMQRAEMREQLRQQQSAAPSPRK